MKACCHCGKPADSKGAPSYCRLCWNARQREWNKRNPVRHAAINKKIRIKRKQEVIDAYGGKCACCQETTYEFLTIDHINGGGRKHLQDIKRIHGLHFYTWLRNNNFPKTDFRLLCWNCNCALGHYGYCPHTKQSSK